MVTLSPLALVRPFIRVHHAVVPRLSASVRQRARCRRSGRSLKRSSLRLCSLVRPTDASRAPPMRHAGEQACARQAVRADRRLLSWVQSRIKRWRNLHQLVALLDAPRVTPLRTVLDVTAIGGGLF